MAHMSMFASRRTTYCLSVGKGLSIKLPIVGQHVIRAAATVRCTSAEPAPRKRSLVFLGTPSVAADVLDVLLDASEKSSSIFEVTAIVTQPPSIRGRGRKQLPSPVEQLALDRSFPSARIFSPPKVGEEAFMAELKRLTPDLCVTAAYGNILPNRFLATPICGTVNVHPSLLPQYRGAAPVQRAVQDGANFSGVTLAYTVRALDAGPIIASERMDLDSTMKAPEILKILFQKGSELLLKELPAILDGTARAKVLEQDHTKATLAPKVKVEESWLNFEQPAEILHNKVRAFAEWPGSRAAFQLCSAGGKVETLELKVVTTRVGRSSPGSNHGREVTFVNDTLRVPCGGDSTLEIMQLQPPAKKVMSARDFWNGLRGQTLWKDVNGTLVPAAHLGAFNEENFAQQ